VPTKKLTTLLCILGLLCAPALALDRNAFTFVRYDLRATLELSEAAMEVRGHLLLRNDSPAPQRVLALQISSTLDWQSIKAEGKPAAYIAQPYTTDIDHTGSVREAIVSLPAEVAPKSTIDLEIVYSGTVPLDSTRLTRIGVPERTATRSDWDRIGETFTALRGVGYVCWYPVAMDAVSLSEGASVFTALGEWKARHAASTMRLTLVMASDLPVVANGRLLGQKATAQEDGTVHEREYEFAPLGNVPPAFAVAGYTVLGRSAIDVFYLADHPALAEAYVQAAEKLSPFLDDWFGPQREKVAVVELPEGDAPFDSGAMFFTPLNSDRQGAEVAMAHPLVHARLDSPRLWIEEGLAHFAQALVREHQDGRKAALDYLQQFRPAVAEAERQARPASSASGAESGGEPLIRSTDEVYYRGKAMFVWWMLRDMAGDAALQHVLGQYRAADDKEPGYLQRLLETQTKRSFAWFFDDWVYRDRGLPEFHIVSASPRELLTGQIGVTVTVENTGGAGAEVPVFIPVQNGEALQRLRVPARAQTAIRITVPALPREAVVNDGSVPEGSESNSHFEIKKAVGN
jgi:hypothetical protein